MAGRSIVLCRPSRYDDIVQTSDLGAAVVPVLKSFINGMEA